MSRFCYARAMSIVVATFYHFFDFANRAAQRDAIFAQLDQLGVRGTLLLTPEGINSTLSGTRAGIDAALAYLKAEVTHADFEHKESFCAQQPFARLKVKLKKETISLGEEACVIRVGTYIAPEDWNALITQPDVVVIDTRNDYEYHLGTFQGAVNPDIANFRQLPAFARGLLGDDKNRRIATFCTGGIRCEKFTAWLLAQGYQNVYHLKGGILKYLEDIPPPTACGWASASCSMIALRLAPALCRQPRPAYARCAAIH